MPSSRSGLLASSHALLFDICSVLLQVLLPMLQLLMRWMGPVQD